MIDPEAKHESEIAAMRSTLDKIAEVVARSAPVPLATQKRDDSYTGPSTDPLFGATIEAVVDTSLNEEAAIKEYITQIKSNKPIGQSPLGVKYDSDKADWSLLPIEPVEEIIQVLMFGAKKYAPDNWKHVDNGDVRYYNAAMRHILAWKKGEKTDSETGINHLAHAACCLLFLQWKDAQDNKHNKG